MNPGKAIRPGLEKGHEKGEGNKRQEKKDKN